MPGLQPHWTWPWSDVHGHGHCAPDALTSIVRGGLSKSAFALEPHGGELWVPWDRTAGVIGPKGCGKTLDPARSGPDRCPGAAITRLTKVDDLLLTFTARSSKGRPCVTLDPFNLVLGLPEVVWDTRPWVRRPIGR